MIDKKILLEIISYYNNVTGYKVNVQKSITFLYSSNEQVEFVIKNTVAFTLAPNKRQYLGMNLTKCVQDLYEENYKTLIKEIKKELNKWSYSVLWIERLNMSRC